MDAALFKRILERRLALQAELLEIDNFIRQAEALAARLFPPHADSARYVDRRPLAPEAPSDNDATADNMPFSFSPLPSRVRTD